MKKFVTVLGIASVAVMAMALITHEKAFYSHYKIEKGSTIEKMKCSPCHAKPAGGKLNPYGEDLKAALAGSKKVAPSHFTAIDGKDSDKDGMKNGDEIKAGRNPGAAG